MIKFFLILCLTILALPVNACVQLVVEEYWGSSRSVAIGLIKKASLFYRDESPYVKYTLSNPLFLKGGTKKTRNSLKVISNAYRSPLRVGLSFIVFINEDGYVDSCGPAQPFEKDWIESGDIDFESDEQKTMVNSLRELVNKHN